MAGPIDAPTLCCVFIRPPVASSRPSANSISGVWAGQLGGTKLSKMSVVGSVISSVVAHPGIIVTSNATMTRTTVAIDIPTNVKESYILDNEIGFRISTSAGITDVYAMSMTNVTGSLPDTPGRHFIVIKHLGDGVVIE